MLANTPQSTLYNWQMEAFYTHVVIVCDADILHPKRENNIQIQ
jgi:hypothetical protein